MQSKTTISQKRKTLDTLYLQLDIQSRAIRMTKSRRAEAEKIRQIILKTDKKRPTK
jgi:hypothetical protein